MITIVSGLPRSGTSLMMQMLDAGGLPVLSDGERKADTDNPKGYLEWERIKQLPKDPSLIAEAEGKVVKVISQLILSLPSGHEYRVLLMQRPLPEVLKSQDEMLRRRGNADSNADTSAIEEATTSFSSTSLATSAAVRITISVGIPWRNFWAMAPTAPNSPARSRPVCALNFVAMLATRPCAAPPLRTLKLVMKRVPSPRSGCRG